MLTRGTETLGNLALVIPPLLAPIAQALLTLSVIILCHALAVPRAAAEDTTPPSTFDLNVPVNGGWCADRCRFDWETTIDNVGVAKFVLYVNGVIAKDNLPPSSSEYTLSVTEKLSEGPVYTWYVQACDAAGNCRQSESTRSLFVDATAPESFDLLDPMPDAWGSIRRDVSFRWEAATDTKSGVVAHALWIDGERRETLSPGIGVRRASDSALLPGLLTPGVHTWQISAEDAVGNVRTSDVRTLRIDNEPPAVPVMAPSPATGSWIGTSAPVLQWLASADVGSGLKSQTIAIDYGAGANQNASLDTNIDGSCVREPGRPGWWRCGQNSWQGVTYCGVCNYGTSIWSASSQGRSGVAFVRMSGARSGDTYGPSRLGQRSVITDGGPLFAVMSYRADGNRGEPIVQFNVKRGGTSFVLKSNPEPQGSWIEEAINLSSYSGSPFDYEFTCTQSAGSCSVDSIRLAPPALAFVTDTVETTALALSSPLADGWHEWHVLASDHAGNTGSSPTFRFGVDTTPPVAPFLSAVGGVGDGAAVSIPTPMLCWDGASDSGSGVAGFRLIINDAVSRDNIAAGSRCATPGLPLLEGKHRWTVEVFDAVGNASRSAISWEVIYDTNPPSAFDLISPADGTQIAAPRPTLSWAPSNDIGSGLARYEVYIDGLCTLCNVSPAITSVSPVSDLAIGHHRWFVRAVDGTGATTSSNQVFSFAVLATPTPTATGTDTPTTSPTSTPTPTDTSTPTFSCTPSLTYTPTLSPTVTATNTATFTYTPTPTYTPTLSPTVTATNKTTPTHTLTSTPTPTPTPTLVLTCVGDCGDDGAVTVDEIIRGVNIALGTATVGSCAAFDVNSDGAVTVDDLVKAVNAALNGCKR